MNEQSEQIEPTVMNRVSIAVQNMTREDALEWLIGLYGNVEGMIVALAKDLGREIVTSTQRLQWLIDVEFPNGYAFGDGEFWEPTEGLKDDPNVMRTTI